MRKCCVRSTSAVAVSSRGGRLYRFMGRRDSMAGTLRSPRHTDCFLPPVSTVSLRVPSSKHQATASPSMAHEQQAVRSAPLGQMGFRPFFLLAALFAAGVVPLWLFVLSGSVALTHPGGAIFWHAHEMVFGYTVAVIAGFLLTATIRWTGRPTASGGALYALAALWVAGRVAMLLSGRIPAAAVLVLDLAFLPAVAVAVGRAIVAERQRRNYVMIVLLGALWLANLIWHLGVQGVLGAAPMASVHIALDLVTLMMLIIGARVIPMFTRNVVGDPSIRSSRAADRATAVAMVALIVSGVAQAPVPFRAALAAVVAVCALFSARHWGTWTTRRHPMLWVLHVGYSWIPIALLLRSLQGAGAPISASCAIHALTAGAIGTLTLGMMARVSLGHTGRVITASPIITASFVLITGAALVRTVLPELGIEWARSGWVLSGVAWAGAFTLFLVKFGPLLLAPRVDGKPG